MNHARFLATVCIAAMFAPGAFVGPAVAQPANAVVQGKPPAKIATPANRARHEKCLAFIHRHGLSCDPWVQPTCGYAVGVARPLECVAP